jgi:aminopeptidase N
MSQHVEIHLKDYTPYPFTVSTVHLRVELDPKQTTVTARSRFQRKPAAASQQTALELDGEQLTLLSVSVDGRTLDAGEYLFDNGKLRIAAVPEQFELEIITQIAPENNTSLTGLYLSAGNYCTQCEAEGFRRLTCWPDRPDVLAVFTVTLIGSQATCPILLANGNLIEQGRLEDGRHFAVWHDPFPKPSYLFALVAGQLVCIEDSFITRSGRTVSLHIYVEERNRDKCAHAMQSLKHAMRWDEEAYGREYDLDRYMIVAVDDFNMGAMENKGLNIFNSKYVLAKPETATDDDYEHIESVIAHEYFHNWTGNRITCRDWFQLSLKEGLTVFRDQEFSADAGSRAVKRINDASYIRNVQFREDCGPTAHPVRPASYVEINNFYTPTVYDKGAEVIRMLHTLLGAAGFRKGMDMYFARHDGQAVTCEDFLKAMQDANSYDLSQFHRWYTQAGTPVVRFSGAYNAKEQVFTLSLSQTCPATPGQPNKLPFLIPVRVGLLDQRTGAELRDELLLLDQASKEFRFTGLKDKPLVSFNRNFSAPIKVESSVDNEQLAFLMAHDRDPVNRWDAGQQLGLDYILNGILAWQNHKMIFALPELFHQAFAALLNDTASDPAFIALSLVLPTEGWIIQQMDVIDPDAVFVVRQTFRNQLGRKHHKALLERYHRLHSAVPYRYTGAEAGRRVLRGCCLAFLASAVPGESVAPELLALAIQHYRQADNMTDELTALSLITSLDQDVGDAFLAEFYAKWQHDPLVVTKWIALQAAGTLPGTLARVKELLRHPAVNLKNPNKVRALLNTFGANLRQFHAPDGSGYSFIADCVLELDPINPQVAARVVNAFTQWRRYDAARQKLMLAELRRIAALPNLSRDVAEIVVKSVMLDGDAMKEGIS